MNELTLTIAAIAIVLLLIIILISFLVQKRKSKDATLGKCHKVPEPATQAENNKPANKPILDTPINKEPLPEPQAEEPSSPANPESKPFVESKSNETGTLPSIDSGNNNIPQDSMLRRHYLANLRAMIESINLPRPTDSALSRHHDSLIATEIKQCINDTGAIERLICKYEAHKKSLAHQIKQQANPKMPEGSVLSQQINTNLNDSAEFNIPPRPTDSVLRRHYDTMINAEIIKLLNHAED